MISNILSGFQFFFHFQAFFPFSSFKVLHLNLIFSTNSLFLFLYFVLNNFFVNLVGSAKRNYSLSKFIFIGFCSFLICSKISLSSLCSSLSDKLSFGFFNFTISRIPFSHFEFPSSRTNFL